MSIANAARVKGRSKYNAGFFFGASAERPIILICSRRLHTLSDGKDAEMISIYRPHGREQNRISRRNIIKAAAGIGAGGAISLALSSCSITEKRVPKAVTKRRINQSVAYWCFQKYWDLPTTCRIASQLGCKSVELVEPQDWPILKSAA